MTDDEAQILDEYKEEIEEIDANATKKEELQLEVKLHLFLFRAAKNRYVFYLLESLLYQALRFWLSMRHEYRTCGNTGRYR